MLIEYQDEQLNMMSYLIMGYTLFSKKRVREYADYEYEKDYFELDM